ncbi:MULTISPECIES: PP2C family protein-serine/threonine phosphatase [Streptomyces]|uniref:PP2C family protein-serine/threonine phosphatase n=1 Tax=Streptomyces TaxID=1883 RepID=UPI001AD9F6BB|nr:MULTISPECIES: PP2C family protein-serine/threonine phosphatase [unclassified Streptomyces]MDT0423661.1 PP2C family protein-serine/threonine phosphatase [Streptomyces sp. DSM 41859]WEH25847.1 PP2C family protein-serine/threonine phosphatase [Streptomyces sp. AM 3-1-1]
MRVLGAGTKRVAAWRRDPVLLAPAVLTVVIGLAAILTPPQIPFTRLLVVAPALAASLWRVRGTLLLGGVCALAVLAYAVLDGDHESMFTAGAIAAVGLAAAYASHLRTQRERTLSEVEAVANTTQEVLLRPVARHVAHLEIATLYLAAAPHAKVGGDFYAAADTPFGLRLLLGDVRGKGLPAVGVAAALLGSFHEVAYEARGLAEVAERLDTSMGRYCRSRTGSRADAEEFATAILVEIPRGGTHLSFLNCGHPPALLFHEDAPRSLDPPAASPPINLAEILGTTYTVERVPFGPGDTLLLYTDGVTETRAPGGAFFPLERWAGGVPAGFMPQELLRRLHRALLAQSRGKLDDDIACLAVRYEGPAPPA